MRPMVRGSPYGADPRYVMREKEPIDCRLAQCYRWKIDPPTTCKRIRDGPDVRVA